MGFKKAFQKFEADYEVAETEMLVLTSESLGGAGMWEKGIWQPSAEFLACVNTQSGEFKEEKGVLLWLAEDKDSGKWIFNLKPLTIYKIKCRRRLQKAARGCSNYYMLTKVLSRNAKNEQLKAVRERYCLPVEINDSQCGKFILERRYSWFSGSVSLSGSDCSVYLECDEDDGDTADNALRYFKKIYSSRSEWDKRLRAFAAEELTELANDWQEDSAEDGDPISRESFAERIILSEFSVDPEGGFNATFLDDDMFFGHWIVVYGDVNGGPESADIEG